MERAVRACFVCAVCKTPCQLPAGKLMPPPVPQRPWSHIAVDFVMDLTVSKRYTVMLVVVDRFLKGIWFLPFLPTALKVGTLSCCAFSLWNPFGHPL